MNVDVGKAIRELLFEHPAVIVPGLGGFTATPESATVDYVQGVVLPPTKRLNFNPNLVINDGMLVHHLQQSNLITFQEAGDTVNRYVASIKEALERREIVEIPMVGRLYKDYEQKIRFMAEGTNFSTDAFGLPNLQFSPVARERKADNAATVAASAAAPTAKPAARKSQPSPPPIAPSSPNDPVKSGTWAQSLMPWLVVLSAIVLATSLYLIFSGGPNSDADTLAVDKERLNVKPSVEETDSLRQGSTGETTTDETPASAAPEKSVPESADTEEDVLAPGQSTTFIVVHSFGVRSNATKFAQSLSEAGYAPETRKVANLYRVGVVFPYKSQQEVSAMISELGKKFDAKPKTEEELAEQN